MTTTGRPVPAYRMIKEDILRQIDQGELLPDQCLLSERDMCLKYGISRMTVRQAINELEMQGYLYRIQGKGTFVSSRKMEQPLIGITGFSDDMRSRGKVPGSQMLAAGTRGADKTLASALSVPLGSQVIELKRLRLADHVPMALEDAYLNYDLCKDILKFDLSNASLYHILKEELGLELRKGRQYMEATRTDAAQSKLLEVPEGTVALAIERHISTGDGTPLEVVYSVYRGDLFRFYIELDGTK